MIEYLNSFNIAMKQKIFIALKIIVLLFSIWCLASLNLLILFAASFSFPPVTQVLLLICSLFAFFTVFIFNSILRKILGRELKWLVLLHVLALIFVMSMVLPMLKKQTESEKRIVTYQSEVDNKIQNVKNDFPAEYSRLKAQYNAVAVNKKHDDWIERRNEIQGYSISFPKSFSQIKTDSKSNDLTLDEKVSSPSEQTNHLVNFHYANNSEINIEALKSSKIKKIVGLGNGYVDIDVILNEEETQLGQNKIYILTGCATETGGCSNTYIVLGKTHSLQISREFPTAQKLVEDDLLFRSIIATIKFD
jgi:hypothetical protein